jgi:hypothetical protein
MEFNPAKNAGRFCSYVNSISFMQIYGELSSKRWLDEPWMSFASDSEVKDRRAIIPGNANSFCSVFLPKVNATFQKCEKTP